MKNREGYNIWAATYDTVMNKTRDLEAHALKKTLGNNRTSHVLEIGCGTGKNTSWLAQQAQTVTSLDFSEEMIAKAQEKIIYNNVTFLQADLTQDWPSLTRPADLIVASLVLEHIEDLDFIFDQAKNILTVNGLFYICELHPFKQYSGSKARFETNDGLVELDCYTHNVSDYLHAAKNNGFDNIETEEWFDDNNRKNIPRLVSLLFRKL